MRKLRERRKVETSGVASKPGVASTSKVAQVMDIDTDSEQSTQSQMESTQYSTRLLCNSHNSTFVIHSFCYPCNKCILIHKTFIYFHISTCIYTFSCKKASVVSLEYYPLLSLLFVWNYSYFISNLSYTCCFLPVDYDRLYSGLL
jgi:hypothetical protein